MRGLGVNWRGWGRQPKTAVVEPAAVGAGFRLLRARPEGFTMASTRETGRRPTRGRNQETVRRAKLHLSTASHMPDCAATPITRASELASDRDDVGDELAEDIAAFRSSARMPGTFSASEG